MRSHLRLVHATDLPLEPPRRRDRRRTPPSLRLVAPYVAPGAGCAGDDRGVGSLADELRADSVDASAWFVDPLLDIEGRFDR